MANQIIQNISGWVTLLFVVIIVFALAFKEYKAAILAFVGFVVVAALIADPAGAASGTWDFFKNNVLGIGAGGGK